MNTLSHISVSLKTKHHFSLYFSLKARRGIAWLNGLNRHLLYTETIAFAAAGPGSNPLVALCSCHFPSLSPRFLSITHTILSIKGKQKAQRLKLRECITPTNPRIQFRRIFIVILINHLHLLSQYYLSVKL